MTNEEEIKKFTQGFAYQPIDAKDKPSEVCFKYYLPEHKSEVFVHINAQKMYSLLWDIDQDCRAKVKYGDNIEVANFAQTIRDMIHLEINLDEMNG